MTNNNPNTGSTTITIPNKLIVVAMALLVVIGYGAFIYLTH